MARTNRPGFNIPAAPREYSQQWIQDMVNQLQVQMNALIQGVSGTFVSNDGKSVRIENGIVVEILE